MNINSAVYQTDQIRCYDGRRREIDCAGTGQDGDIRAGHPWPKPRFEEKNAVVKDILSGLMWTKNATPAEFPQTWGEAFEYVNRMNASCSHGYDDWRLPNIRELESLVVLDQHSPALPESHPFQNVGQGYWSSTTSVYDTSFAWVLYSDDGNVGVGFKKKADFGVWPVRS
jgi:hypothetical protein